MCLAFRHHPKLIGEKTITICKHPDSQEEEILDKQLNIVIKMLETKQIPHRGISKTKIGFISGNGENPLLEVPYFKKSQVNAYKVTNYSSFMAPKNCQEYVYRIYIRNFLS